MLVVFILTLQLFWSETSGGGNDDVVRLLSARACSRICCT